MTARPRILVTPRSLTADGVESAAVIEPLRARGYDLVVPSPGRQPTRDELLGALPGCVGWVAGVEVIDTEVLEAADVLRVISRNGTGVDGIDLAAAERRGVRVLRAEGANAQGVAELNLALVLCALRGIVGSATALRNGGWDRSLGAELADRKVGIVGLGAVGRRTARMLEALGAPVVATDPFVESTPFPLLELDELLEAADVVVLCCPPTSDGLPLLTAERIARLRPGAVLVNAARSSLVDDDAVLASLEAGTLACYAVDAFDTEPPAPSPLLAHERVLATAHIGGFTGASVRRAGEAAVANLVTALEEGR